MSLGQLPKIALHTLKDEEITKKILPGINLMIPRREDHSINTTLTFDIYQLPPAVAAGHLWTRSTSTVWIHVCRRVYSCGSILTDAQTSSTLTPSTTAIKHLMRSSLQSTTQTPYLVSCIWRDMKLHLPTHNPPLLRQGCPLPLGKLWLPNYNSAWPYFFPSHTRANRLRLHFPYAWGDSMGRRRREWEEPHHSIPFGDFGHSSFKKIGLGFPYLPAELSSNLN